MLTSKFKLTRWLLLASSLKNILKHSKDKTKRSNAIGNMVGLGVLYFFLAAFIILQGIGLIIFDLLNTIPIVCGLIITLLSFLFTLFKTNGYLFEFKEYELLMALPFSIKDVVASRFLYMYIKQLPMMIIASISSMLCYVAGLLFTSSKSALGIVYTVICWIILSVVLPLIPTVVATLFGAFIAKAGSRSKHKKGIQIVLTFAVMIPLVCLRFVIEKAIKTNGVENILNKVSDGMNAVSKILPWNRWFEQAVSGNVLYALLLAAVSILVFEFAFAIIAKYYLKINSLLKTSSVHKRFKMQSQKQNSIIKALVYKEWKRMTGSTVYFTNAFFGQIIIGIVGICGFFVDLAKIMSQSSQTGVEVDMTFLIPALAFMVHLMVGMIPTTCCTPSLEGKSEWIIKSLPISKWDIARGKIIYNLIISLPFSILGTVGLSYSFKASWLQILLNCLLTCTLCVWSTLYGMICGIKRKNLDWENEVEVVKQGPALTAYIFVHLGISILGGTAVVFAGMLIGKDLAVAVVTILLIVVSILTTKAAVKVASNY